MSPRYSAVELTAFARSLLAGAGLDAEKSAAVAEILVEGDLLGHSTHGLQLLAPYLAELEKGSMAREGEPGVIADYPAAVTWDGRRLPGPWLTRKGLALAAERARRLGTATVAIRRSHHIACLAAYLRPIAEQGLMALLTCSDPSGGGVAPHGARRSVYTPDPIAAAWPTEGEPVVLDVSMSITTNGLTKRLQAERHRFPGAWAVDGQGRLTDDPAAISADPPGALLPLGGADHGHKGFALGLLVEALTGGLAGHGRADRSEGWSANVFIQVLDPAAYGGRDDFVRQVSWLAAACRNAPPREGFERVRLPGEGGLRRRSEQLAAGLELYPGILEALGPWAGKFRIAPPAPRTV
ncbi:MAG TPA: Ldh family oxidoreductase [Opitutaceae bacterium]|jgi:L-lactate dehydrogenase|nr:Ldh family oxidoreductase [Opitutaceae bacterium]